MSQDLSATHSIYFYVIFFVVYSCFEQIVTAEVHTDSENKKLYTQSAAKPSFVRQTFFFFGGEMIVDPICVTECINAHKPIPVDFF